ncbi:MAG: xanthine dehydrogenase family protein molybdopterin-binding subunit [Hyphomicrobiales bacterium]|nr:xanthine dehydrogenase family protein molybdopterin-binding subunit [Hyphomicrobiales bacterium]
MTEARGTSHGAAIARRTFLAAAGVVGGGLLVGAGAVAWRLKSIDGYRLPARDGESSFGAWLRIDRDGRVEVVVPHQEMGQGIYSLAVLLAAEGLKLSPDSIRAAPAPVEARYANPVMLLDGLPMDDAALTAPQKAVVWTFDKILRALGLQGTGGSTSTRNIAEPIRAASASALDMLMRAASDRLGATVSTLKAENGRISAPNGKSATYGELAADAAKLTPAEIVLPPLGPGVYVGKGAPRFDVVPKTFGRATYGIDTREQGQLYAAIRHSPRIGGRLEHAVLSKQIAGVRGVVEGRDYFAVVADSYAVALAALDSVNAKWDDSKALNVSTEGVMSAYRAALERGVDYKPRWVIDSAGDVSKAEGKAVKARYDAPFLAHTTMEPINATALVTETSARVWAGHQSASLVQMMAAKTAGLDSDKVEVVTPFLGGGFGRRADLGYVVKAVEIASRFKGKPVQTIWSRAEDIRDDVFRPAAMADISATLGTDGAPTSFVYRIAVPSVTDQFVARALPSAKGGLMADRTTVDGALFPLYGLPNRSIENFTVDSGVPVGFWRSVGYGLNCFFMESFVDELAAAASQKPLDYRARLLGAAGDYAPARRGAALLERMGRFDRDNPLAPGADRAKTGRGFALTECFHSFVGQIADVEISGVNLRVKRVHAVVDCGFAIDPPNVAAQIRSGINFGLTAALFGKVDFDGGRVVPTNFDSYPLLQLDQAPEISVEIVNSGAPLGGVGEIGTPAIAPAVANAVFAATGKRLRSLPLALTGA